MMSKEKPQEPEFKTLTAVHFMTDYIDDLREHHDCTEHDDQQQLFNTIQYLWYVKEVAKENKNQIKWWHKFSKSKRAFNAMTNDLCCALEEFDKDTDDRIRDLSAQCVEVWYEGNISDNEDYCGLGIEVDTLRHSVIHCYDRYKERL